jgi:hypothetical protein
MTGKSILKTSIAALALALAVVGPVRAESGFATLAGIEAVPMSAGEMEAVQGRNFPIFSPPINDPLSAFNTSIAAALGVSPAMVNALFPGFNAVIGNAFSQGPTMYSGINTVNGLLAALGGTPFVPVGSPFPADFPAASAAGLNPTLALAGQPGLPMLPGGLPPMGVPSGFGFNWCGVSIC